MVQRLRKYFFSITAENFLFFGKSTVLFLLLPYSAVEIKHITHFPRDTFPRRAHFVIMEFLRNRTGKPVYLKLGTLMLKGIDLHKLSSPNSSAVRLGWVCSNILGAAGGW